MGLPAKAQIYSFSQGSASYEMLDNPFVLLTDTQDMFNAIYLTGNFKAYNQALDSYVMVSQHPYLFNIMEEGNVVIMAAMELNLLPGKSEVSALVVGSGANRILKVQYKDMVTSEDTGANLNVQIWIYEREQKIELHFGPGSSNKALTCGLMLMSPDNSTAYDYSILSGDPSSPVLNNSGSSKINGWPANGTVYTFSILSTGVKTVAENDFVVYPNPSAGSFQIEGTDVGEVQAFDALGKEVNVTQTGTTYTIQEAKVGVYQLQIVSKSGGIRTKRITVY